MGSKHFENRARREWWSIHIEAWRRSGLSQRLYCRRHRLTETTFSRWLKVLVDDRVLRAKAEIERDKRLERRRRKAKPLSNSQRSKAVQAFWAMHVEALNWSGMSAAHYAAALGVSAHSLRRWRDLLDAEDVSIDWRSRLHPSALPKISTKLSTSAKAVTADCRLTEAAAVDLPSDGRSNRRRFSAKEKLAIVLETERPGTTVSQVARNHCIVTSVLFRWRAELGFGREKAAKLVSVRLAGKEEVSGASALMLQNLLPVPDGMAAVDLLDGRRVFAPAGADPEAVRRHVAEREAAR